MCTYVFFPVFLSGCLELCVWLSFSRYFFERQSHDYGFFIKRFFIEWRFNTETIKHTAHNQLSYILFNIYRYMYISYYYVSYCLLRYIIFIIIAITIDTLYRMSHSYRYSVKEF